ncbi:MAG: glycosyltransferase family 2 protein [Cyanobacteriota bacterium]|nr:glycosyltransferase family 2 protein [Cyanobacteriota bacterium]
MRESPPQKIPVSVLIPAKNEELNLPACLESVAPAAEIFVVDSHSSDRTVEIAREHGARAIQFDFEAEKARYDAEMREYKDKLAHLRQSKQPLPLNLKKPLLRKKKNWSLDTLPFSHEWVLIVNCDERITSEQWVEIEQILQNPKCEGYYIKRRVYFLGTGLRHGGQYPNSKLRLFKHQRGRYEDLGLSDIPNTGDNEVRENVILRDERNDRLPAGVMENPMNHIEFRNIHQWLERHNRHSNWEAAFEGNLLSGELRDSIEPNLLKAPQRIRLLRLVWARLPFKPLFRFIFVYFVQFGFLDGRAGYIYARLISQYQVQISVNKVETPL